MKYIFVWIYENGVKELDPKLWFQWTFRPSLGPVNGEKVEKGGRRKEDKHVEEGKSTDFAFNFYIVDFGEVLVKIFHTVFINPVIFVMLQMYNNLLSSESLCNFWFLGNIYI